MGLVVVSDRGFVKTLPRGWLACVRRDELTPAKGPGGTTLSLELLRSGQPDLPHTRLELANRPPTPGILQAKARTLAAALALPLAESSFADV